MSVVLEPPLTSSSPSIIGGHRVDPLPLMHGPAFVTTDRCTRWHRVRSGTQHSRPPLAGYRTAWSAWTAWCGQGFFDYRARTADVLDEGAVLCATCEGRAVGAGHPPHHLIPSGPVLFSPRRLDPPKWCPGSGAAGLSPMVRVGDLIRRASACVVCGDEHRIWGRGGWSNPHDGLVTHQPGPGLVMGCALHAWRHLVITTEGVVLCACEVGDREHWRLGR